MSGLDTQEMASLPECSLNTVKSVKSGRLKISASLAARMASTTGLSEDWLLAGDRPMSVIYHKKNGAECCWSPQKSLQIQWEILSEAIHPCYCWKKMNGSQHFRRTPLAVGLSSQIGVIGRLG